ncbi:MAG: hypothetical protein HY787_03280 [Deltaproteobacteria bacterium]|nr:hypothetical protein [Deltaproteobacteria bacterium]
MKKNSTKLKQTNFTYLSEKLEPEEVHQIMEGCLRSLRDLFIRESQKRPMVLVIEDLHWIGACGTAFFRKGLFPGQFKENVDKMPEVIHLIEKAGRESDFFKGAVNPYSFISGFTGLAFGHNGRFEEGNLFLQKALQNAEMLDDPVTLGLTLLFYGCLYSVKGDWKSAKEFLEKTLIYSEEEKFLMVVVIGLIFIGYVHSHLEDPETGRGQAEKGLKMIRDSGIEAFLAFCYWIMGSIHLNLQDMESAQISLEEALRLSRKNGEKGWEGLALAGLGRVFSKKNLRDKKKTEEFFSQGLAILNEQKMKPWVAQEHMFLGEFYLDEGDKEKALENLKEAEGMFLEMEMDYWLDRTRKVLETVK